MPNKPAIPLPAVVFQSYIQSRYGGKVSRRELLAMAPPIRQAFFDGAIKLATLLETK